MTPFSLQTLQNDDEKTRDRIFDHLQKFYRRYMAQYISANMRISTDSSTATARKRDGGIVDIPTLEGVYTPTTGQRRLMQARTPKLVLQAMLAFMVVCAGLALYLGRYHDLVPLNPCTIAGLLILFVDSRMCTPRNVPLDVSNPLTQKQDSYSWDSLAKRDGGQNVTTYELTYSPNQGPPRARDQDDTETIQAVVQRAESTQTDISTTTTSMDWKNPRARFRLGWWDKGRFVGSRHPSQQSPARQGGGWYDRVLPSEEGQDRQDYDWRYGIDVL